MTPRALASIALAVLLACFSFGRGPLVLGISAGGLGLLSARMLLLPKIWGKPLPFGWRRRLHLGLLAFLWICALVFMTTDLFRKEVFLPVFLLGGAWFVLDQPSERLLDSLYVGLVALAAVFVVGTAGLPGDLAIAASAMLGTVLLMAFASLDLGREVEGRAKLFEGSKRRGLASISATLVILLAAFLGLWIPVEKGAPWERSSPGEKPRAPRPVSGISTEISLNTPGDVKLSDATAFFVRAEESRGSGPRRRWTHEEGSEDAPKDAVPLLWRGRVFVAGGLHTWSPSVMIVKDPPRRFGGLQRTTVHQEFEVALVGSPALFSLADPVACGDSRVRILQDGSLQHRNGLVDEPMSYQVTSSVVPPAARAHLRRAPCRHPSREYRRPPVGISADVKRLAESWAYGKASAYEKIDAILRRLRGGEFTYSRSNPNVGPDPIRTFLLETRTGYCQHFAAAFAVLLRHLDLPARPVNGYRGGTYDAKRGAYRLLQRDAHAWVEVHFDDIGWIPFDPTPPVQALDVALDGDRDANGSDAAGPALGSAQDPQQGGGGHLPLLTWIAAGGCILIVLVWGFRQRARSLGHGAQRTIGTALAAQLRQTLRRFGALDHASCTLLEMLDTANALPRETFPDVAAVIGLIYRERFGRRSVSTSEMGFAQGVLDRLRPHA